MRITMPGLAITGALWASAANGAEPGSLPLPSGVAALQGCWQGTGAVMDKPVTITLSARPIVLGAMFVVDAQSTARADPQDRYAAQLTFGGAKKPTGASTDPITGFWADSFGGSFATSGSGANRPDGFDMTYPYPDAAFVNQWRQTGDRLTWTIVAHQADGQDSPFARYTLTRVPCPGADASLIPPAPDSH